MCQVGLDEARRLGDPRDVEDKIPDTDPAPAPDKQPYTKPEITEPTLFGQPLAVFVKGGTTTSRHDQAVAELSADATARRAEADRDRQIASIPIEEGGAVMHGGRLLPGQDAEAPVIQLLYLTPGGETRYENGDEFRCLADLTVMDGGELCLILVCPTCKDRKVPQDQCQLRIRSSNKKMEYSGKGEGDLIMFDDGFTGPKAYRSAGTIVESERFTCGQCGWTARIVNNTVRPDR